MLIQRLSVDLFLGENMIPRVTLIDNSFVTMRLCGSSGDLLVFGSRDAFLRLATSASQAADLYDSIQVEQQPSEPTGQTDRETVTNGQPINAQTCNDSTLSR